MVPSPLGTVNPVGNVAFAPNSLIAGRVPPPLRHHLKIRLAAAHMNLSLQDIMTDALDRDLAEIKPPNLNGVCNCLAGPKIHSGGA